MEWYILRKKNNYYNKAKTDCYTICFFLKKNLKKIKNFAYIKNFFVLNFIRCEKRRGFESSFILSFKLKKGMDFIWRN